MLGPDGGSEVSAGHLDGLDERDEAHVAPCTEGAADTCFVTALGGRSGDYPPGAGAMRAGRPPSAAIGVNHPAIGVDHPAIGVAIGVDQLSSTCSVRLNHAP